jgi:YVTN family beta-propeller protein
VGNLKKPWRQGSWRTSRGLALGFILLAACLTAAAKAPKPPTVGRQLDGRIVVPTNQVLQPAGQRLTFPGRPVDLALIADGRTLVVKNMHNLVFIDVAAARITQTLELPRKPFGAARVKEAPPKGSGGAKHPYVPPDFSVVGLQAYGGRIYASGSYGQIWVAAKGADGRYRWVTLLWLASPKVGGPANPAGLTVGPADQLLVTATRGNCVQVLDLERGQVKQVIPVGVAPYMVIRPQPDRAYVSNWGGDPPRPGQPQARSSGTPVHIDSATGVANRGTVSVLAKAGGAWRQVRTIPVGLHPSGMAASRTGKFVYVANANSDSVSVIDTGTDSVVETISTRPASRLPFGSGANALALSPDGGTLYVANGTNNCLAVVRLGARAAEPTTGGGSRPGQSVVAGLIPTDWYPGAVRLSADGRTLFVANVKGIGSLSQPRPVAKGKNVHDYLGSVSIIPVPDKAQLAADTAVVKANNRLSFSLTGLAPPRPGVAPAPVPGRFGEPSVLAHVIYIIKENRTYDQILGDIPEGNGDPSLVQFGEAVTPNQHEMSRQFTLLDNFYCSGALSATGHQWTDEAYVTDYLEKTFGAFVRSYPAAGDDPLAFAASGFLWDNALRHGRTFYDFGEFTRSRYTPVNATWTDLYGDFRHRTHRVKITVHNNIQRLQPYTHPHYPGFPLLTPDVYRARIFIEQLHKWERQGGFPNLIFIWLPQDHTMGTKPGFPTPRAMIADNDLALGRIVEAVSRSKFWPRTVILVVEDDPQFGLDHVDGHRTVALAISPYTRRRFVDHTLYNQTGMVKTIELILGLAPMNQLDLSATPMRALFQAKPDLTPYRAVPNRVPLDEMNPPLKVLTGPRLYWAQKSLELDFSEADRADEDTLNRILWHAARGYDTPYPQSKPWDRATD